MLDLLTQRTSNRSSRYGSAHVHTRARSIKVGERKNASVCDCGTPAVMIISKAPSLCILFILWLVGDGVYAVKRVSPEVCGLVREINRLDCFPEEGANQGQCEERGCCWVPQDSSEPGMPMCFFSPEYATYMTEELNQTDRGFSALLWRNQSSYVANEFKQVRLDAIAETKTRLRLRFTIPSDPNRWEPPIPLGEPEKNLIKGDYDVDVQQSPFGIRISHSNEKDTLLETMAPSVIFSDQFLQVGFKLNAQRGFLPGEIRAAFPHPLTEWRRVGLWARDTVPSENTNLYGVQNIFIGLTPKGTAFGLFLLNSNAQEVVLTPMPSITYRTIGGIMDFFLFSGPRPTDVIAQYYNLIGHPPVPPYWSLGFQLCRYGYKNLGEIEEVVQRNREAGIPLEVQWADIDYMDARKIWTVDNVNFGGLGTYVREKLQGEFGMKFALIVDPAVSTIGGPDYKPYTRGLQMGIFINDSVTKKPLRGRVWPGETVFPDFSHPDAEQWWFESAQDFYKTIPFDGLWIDMNEPADFSDGSINGCPAGNKWDHPPFVPLILDRSLYAKTVCPSALHYNNTPHYNRHNLYGYDHARVTRTVLNRMFPTKRPFVLSRSTFAGSGRYTIHWTGDNLSSWADMRYSIMQIINFNIYGIPMVGADICGFRGDATEELCVRWSQLGAFYPFSRNHNAIASRPQDPATWSANATAAIRAALRTRYHLLPYIYSLFFRAHLNGTAVARALAFEFPEELVTYKINTQFMLGSCLLVNPVLDEGRTYVEAYVPTGEWVDLSNGARIVSVGQAKNFEAPLHVIPVLVRGGCILPLQSTPNITSVSRKDGLSLFVVLSTVDDGNEAASQASGELFWDNGVSEPLSFIHTQFEVKDRVLTLRSSMSHPDTLKQINPRETMLKRILLVGLLQSPESVTMDYEELKFRFLKSLQVVVIDLPEGTTIARDAQIRWRFHH